MDIPQKADTTQVSIVSEHSTHVDIVEEECARFADAIDCRSKSDHLTLTIRPQQPTTMVVPEADNEYGYNTTPDPCQITIILTSLSGSHPAVVGLQYYKQQKAGWGLDNTIPCIL